MITVNNISKAGNTIHMQMKEGEDLLCEAIAQIEKDTAYLEDIVEHKTGFAYDMGKAILNSIDLKGIEKVVCENAKLHKTLERLRFKKENCAYSLLLKGYFSSNCETL